jgi:hypothetical protein
MAGQQCGHDLGVLGPLRGHQLCPDVWQLVRQSEPLMLLCQWLMSFLYTAALCTLETGRVNMVACVSTSVVPGVCRSQHIFIDARQPQNSYSMTYNCVNSADNQKTFNDGYHIQVTDWCIRQGAADVDDIIIS